MDLELRSPVLQEHTIGREGMSCWLRQREEDRANEEVSILPPTRIILIRMHSLMAAHLTSGAVWGSPLQSGASEHEEAFLRFGTGAQAPHSTAMESGGRRTMCSHQNDGGPNIP